MERQALLIIDVQNDFFPGGALPVKNAEKILTPVNSLIDRFYEANRPVFLSRDHHPPKHDSFLPKGVYPPHCVMGTKGAAVHPALKLNGVVTLDKCYSKEDCNMSAFGDGRLEKILSISGVRELVVVGISTEFGIQETVLDAVKKGFRVSVVKEGIVPENSAKADRSIASMVKAGVEFVSIKTALERLPLIEVMRDM